ncbi:MAG: acetolactate synthase small subunit [Phycisphaeraceae bacterium JB051]
MPTMTTEEKHLYRHVIAALVTNEPGVLAQVASMFAARGFNIDSLVVGRTENPELSRMTIVVNGDDSTLEQVRKQLAKLVAVVRIVDYLDAAFVERDLMLVQVSTAGESSPIEHRTELIELANIFRAQIVDVSNDQLMIKMSGTEEKIEAFIDMIKPYGIIEMARTGVIAMSRGNATTARKAKAKVAVSPQANPPAIDPGDLPPG